jgi:hypothetical protein
VHWDGATPTLGAGPFLTETQAFLGQSMAILGFGPWHTFSAGGGTVARHIGPDLSTWGPAKCLTVDGEPFAYFGYFDCDHIRPELNNFDLAGTEPDDVHVVGEHATMAGFDGSDWNLVAGLPT